MASSRVCRLLLKLAGLAFACFLTATTGPAADKPAPSAPPARPTKKLPKCCVWRITNTKAPVYLVGSIHALNENDYPLPAAYDLALHDSRRLLFEFDPAQGDEFERKFDAAGRYPPGQDIRSKVHGKLLWWLRENTQAIDWQYNEKAKQYRAAVGQFDTFLQYRPWWIAHHLFDVKGYADVTGKQGVDNYLATEAKKMGKEVVGLETVDEHVAVLSQLSDRDGEILLLDALVYMDTAGNEYHRMRSAWRRGDIDKVWMLDSRLRREASWIAARLCDQRNIKWIPRIEREIQSGKPTAIVAGVLHFSGPNSVVTLLQRRGYTIEQL
jgi:uncharacterized protein YbaP (TraB family)